MLVKPRTFMNLSGDAIAPIVKYHNATAADLLVIHDDIDLPVGKIRVRKNGSAGGHNGLKSIIARLGTQNFLRLKLGVGKDKTNVIGHVLGKFGPADRKIIDIVVAEAVNAAAKIIGEGADAAMNLYNGWSAALQEGT
jgi:PTH1 family peptidyl-tRNA hydrolase